jgi:ribonuclease BN (tRNA processing enzyme)
MSGPLKLTCVGTGDAFGNGGRLNSCYHLATDQQQLLLDCGCSSLIGLQRCGLDPAELDGLVISHLHGDHFGGIPFLFLEGKFVSQRQRPLTLIGPPGLQRQVEAALDALFPGAIGKGADFPVHYLVLDPDRAISFGAMSIRCCRVVHGSSSEVYALRVDVAGRSLSYTGDTEWTDSLPPLTNGSDLLIAECFAFAEPTPSHLDYQTLRRRYPDLGCRRLVLTHLGAEMLARQAEVDFEILQDGTRIDL